jgi:hypothetical protein
LRNVLIPRYPSGFHVFVASAIVAAIPAPGWRIEPGMGIGTMNHGPLIDTHQHPIPEFYKRAMARVGIMGSGENPWADWSVQAQLDLMDETGMPPR